MRHYEIVFLIHPDQSEKAQEIIERYKEIIAKADGVVHRLEDWGRKALAYPIKKAYKAHYVIMNIECDNQTLIEIENNFRYSDAIIRNLVIKKDNAVTEPSIMISPEDSNAQPVKDAEAENTVK
jgi:small subunit ribosomal protein S6